MSKVGILGAICVLLVAGLVFAAQPKEKSPNQTPPSMVPTEAPARDRSDETETNRRLAAYTKWLAIATVGLVIVGAGEVYLFFRQANIMQEHAGHLGNLVASADNNSKAARRQAEISYSAMVAQFRPLVSVRSMKLDPSSIVDAEKRNITEWTLEITLINSGGTVAHIKNCSATLVMHGEQPSTTLHTYCSQEWPPFSLESGDRYQLKMSIPGVNFPTQFAYLEHVVGEMGREQLRWPECTGTVKYEDGNGRSRQTGFQRRWYMSTKRFIPSGSSPEAEYAD
jgi:hypothetical protein